MTILEDIDSLIEEMFVLPPIKKSNVQSQGPALKKAPMAPQQSQNRQPMMKQGMQTKAPIAPKAPGSN